MGLVYGIAVSYGGALARLAAKGSPSERWAANILTSQIATTRDVEEGRRLRRIFLTHALSDRRDSEAWRLWKAAARDQTLLVKQFGGDRVDEVWLDWEALPGMDTEARLSRLTRWTLDAEAAGHAYGLRLPGRVVAPARGEAHMQQCLTELALFGTAGPAP